MTKFELKSQRHEELPEPYSNVSEGEVWNEDGWIILIKKFDLFSLRQLSINLKYYYRTLSNCSFPIRFDMICIIYFKPHPSVIIVDLAKYLLYTSTMWPTNCYKAWSGHSCFKQFVVENKHSRKQEMLCLWMISFDWKLSLTKFC